MNNLGLALRAVASSFGGNEKARLDEARAALERAVQLQADYADAWSNLGLVLGELGENDRAVECFERALQLAPHHVDALYNLGNVLHQHGRFAEAVERYRRAGEVEPSRADIQNNLGNSLLALQKIPQAVRCYETALALQPDHAEAQYNLGVALAEQDETEGAGQAFERASRLRPEKVLWRLRRELLWPPVFSSAEEVDAAFGRLEAVLDAGFGISNLKFEIFNFEFTTDGTDLSASGCLPPFTLAHQGRDVRPLRAKFAAAFAGCFADENRRLHAELERRQPRFRDRRRIGFVVTRGHEAIFLRCLSGIINGLSVGRFEMLVFASPSGAERVRGAIHHADAHFVPLPEAFSRAAQTLAAAACDVLYYWEVGTDALNYLLPFLRLAPVQATSWGTLATSGVPNVDFYLSSAEAELPEADRFYTERLVRLPSLLACHERPAVDGAYRADDRERLGLPAGKNIYLCPQNLLKFHPGFDALLAGILRNDPHGWLVLVDRPWPRAGQLLRERFQRSMPDVCQRLTLWPALPRPEFLRRLPVADAVLDTIDYGAGSTAYELLGLNVPVVTWPGRLLFGRYLDACYRRLGIGELTARSAEEYVSITVRLGTDSGWRAELRRRIAERSDVLFHDRQAVVAHEVFFSDSHAIS